MIERFAPDVRAVIGLGLVVAEVTLLLKPARVLMVVRTGQTAAFTEVDQEGTQNRDAAENALEDETDRLVDVGYPASFLTWQTRLPTWRLKPTSERAN